MLNVFLFWWRQDGQDRAGCFCFLLHIVRFNLNENLTNPQSNFIVLRVILAHFLQWLPLRSNQIFVLMLPILEFLYIPLEGKRNSRAVSLKLLILYNIDGWLLTPSTPLGCSLP